MRYSLASPTTKGRTEGGMLPRILLTTLLLAPLQFACGYGQSANIKTVALAPMVYLPPETRFDRYPNFI
jgi:hypothetical protein